MGQWSKLSSRRAAVALVLVLLAVRSSAEQRSGPILPGQDIGVIFSAKDLLLGLEEYQGGLGVKIAGDKVDYRLLFDVFLSSVNDSYAAALGVAAERHLPMVDRVSPYVGATLGLEAARTITRDASTGVRTDSLSLPFSLGAIFGVEVFAFRFLSVFAEYGLTGTLEYTSTTQTGPGIDETHSSWDWSLETGMGNKARIGVIVYFAPRRNLQLPGPTRDRPQRS